MNIRNIIYSIIFIILLVLLSCPHLKKVTLIKENISSSKVNPVRGRTPEASDGCLRQPASNGVNPAGTEELNSEEAGEKQSAERIGERIVYDVRLGRVSLGRAVFNHLPRAGLNGKQASLMNFQTKLARFRDLEKIYSDPDTYLPLKVERSISNWPFSEKISEYYDQEKFILTIVKDGKNNQTVIKKDAPIHNAVMLPFYVRGIAKLDPGWTMSINLPNQKFQIKLAGRENIALNGKTFYAYRFESDPKRFEIWISSDEQRIPLKIKGTGALGYTLIMQEYDRAGLEPAPTAAAIRKNE